MNMISLKCSFGDAVDKKELKQVMWIHMHGYLTSFQGSEAGASGEKGQMVAKWL